MDTMDTWKKLMSNAVYIEQIVDLLNKTQIIVIDR